MMTDQFIGRGERIAKTILRKIFPNADITTQVPIENFVTNTDYDFYDEVFQKATIDISMKHKNQVCAIRIQDGHHTSERVSRKDRIQREAMEANGVNVIDIFERESPYLFRNIINYKSFLEVLRPLEVANVKP